jgi:hypothetical protein
MDIPTIISLVEGEGLKIKVADGKPSITGGHPSPELLDILKKHRKDIIAAISSGEIEDKPTEPWSTFCDTCAAKVYDTEDAAFLCDQTKCPFKQYKPRRR